MRFSPAEYRAYQNKRSATKLEPEAAQQVADTRAQQILDALTAKLGGFSKEVPFHPLRNWRFDYANGIVHLAIEVEGVTAEGGRHQRPEGYAADCEKYNQAQLLGWLVLRFTPKQIIEGNADEIVLQAFSLRAATSALDSR